jgi:hypothetical protein
MISVCHVGQPTCSTPGSGENGRETNGGREARVFCCCVYSLLFHSLFIYYLEFQFMYYSLFEVLAMPAACCWLAGWLAVHVF